MIKKSSQNGFTSIIVCLLIMIVLSLITVGFAQIMGREQRAALDRQLSTQAFYAAESGVNDASLELATNPQYTKLDDCNPVTIGGAEVSKEIDPVGPVRSTCVNVNPFPQELLYSPISTNQNNPTVIPMIGVDPAGVSAAISRIEIRWSQAVGNTGSSQFRSSFARDFPSQSAWNSRTGALKVGVILFSVGDGRAQILDRFSEFYLNPNITGTGTVVHGSGTRENIGQIVDGNCISSTCTVSITGIPSYNDLKLVMSSIYRGNNVEIRAYSASNVQLRLTGAQAAIDSTGRSGDVLRRISVRKPLSAVYEGSNGNALISSGDICKLISANTVDTSNSPCGILGNPRGL